MSMERIRKLYAVPAKRGTRVRYTGAANPRFGTIAGTAPGTLHLRIRLDGDKRALPFHPTWELEYLDD